jgi:hypothetical protein
MRFLPQMIVRLSFGVALLAHFVESTFHERIILNRKCPKLNRVDLHDATPGDMSDENQFQTHTGEKQPWLEEDEWTQDEIWWHLDCSRIFEGDRSIHNESTWAMMKGIYQGLVGPELSTINPLTLRNGFSFDVEVKQAENKGRGVFAKQKILKGQHVLSTDGQRACFDDGTSYRQFLALLPPDLSCDIMNWAYVTDESKIEKLGDWDYEDDEDVDPANLGLCVELDESALLNSGGWIEGEDANIAWSKELSEADGREFGNDYYALRDIEDGEELLIDYNHFDVPEGWAWFGL